jgi:hypothetical protein
MEVFTEVLEPLIEVVMLELTLNMFIASMLILVSRNAQGGCLIVNKLSTCINITHSFNFFYCMPHIFFSFYLQNGIFTKKLPFT